MRALAPASYDAHLFTLEVGRRFSLSLFFFSPSPFICGRFNFPRVLVLLDLHELI